MTEDSRSADPGGGGAGTRHDRIESRPTPGPGNSLQHWTDYRNPVRVALNYAVIVAARRAPSLRVKNWLLARIGVTVGEGVAWGLESTPDVLWPERVTVEDHAIVGYDATILCHEFLQDELRLGDVVVGERAMIGAGAVLLPGVRVGAEARVAANSLVADDVPPGATVAGVPAERVTGDQPDGDDCQDRQAGQAEQAGRAGQEGQAGQAGQVEQAGQDRQEGQAGHEAEEG